MAGPLERMNPAAADTADRVRVACSLENRQADPSSNHRRPKLILTVSAGSAEPPNIISVTGREAQTLALLIERGPIGFTSGDASPLGWARRTSAYVHKLRRLGLPITTRRETTRDGASVARYTLAGTVTIVDGGRP